MDLFTERLVQKKVEPKEILCSGALIVLALLLCIAAWWCFAYVAILIWAGVAAGVWYLIPSLLFVEFEYTLTNDELEIDKILAKRKRVSLKKYSLPALAEGGRYTGGEAKLFCPDKRSDNLYYLSEKNGETVVIDPNSTMLKAFSLYMGARFHA